MNDGLIEALRERDKAIRARIAQATADKKKREARDWKRLGGIIGDALLEADRNGDISPELKTNIKAIIRAAPGVDDRARSFVSERGW